MQTIQQMQTGTRTYQLTVGKSIWDNDLPGASLSPGSPWSAPPCSCDTHEWNADPSKWLNEEASIIARESAGTDGYASEPDLQVILCKQSQTAAIPPQQSVGTVLEKAMKPKHDLTLRGPVSAIHLCNEHQAPDMQCATDAAVSDADMCKKHIERIAHMQYLYAAERQFRVFSIFALDSSESSPLTPSMRNVLLDWMMDVAVEFMLQYHTLYLAIHYVDRFLFFNVQLRPTNSFTKIDKSNLQLLGATSLLLASKLEEVQPVSVDEIVRTTADAYSATDLKTMELCILSQLQWQLHTPTASSWWHIYISELVHVILYPAHTEPFHDAKAADMGVAHSAHNSTTYIQMNKAANTSVHHVRVHKVQHILSICTHSKAMRIMDVAMMCVEYTCYLPSHLAAATLFLLLEGLTEYCPYIEMATGYKLQDLHDCMSFLKHVHQSLTTLLLAPQSSADSGVASTCAIKHHHHGRTCTNDCVSHLTYTKYVKWHDASNTIASLSNKKTMTFLVTSDEKVPSAWLRNGNSHKIIHRVHNHSHA